jgi:hypothetical protein
MKNDSSFFLLGKTMMMMQVENFFFSLRYLQIRKWKEYGKKAHDSTSTPAGEWRGHKDFLLSTSSFIYYSLVQ